MWNAVILLFLDLLIIFMTTSYHQALCTIQIKGELMELKILLRSFLKCPFLRECSPSMCSKVTLSSQLSDHLPHLNFLPIIQSRLKPYHIPIFLFNTSLSHYNVSSIKARILFLLFTSKFPVPKFVSCTWMALFSWAPKSLQTMTATMKLK